MGFTIHYMKYFVGFGDVASDDAVKGGNAGDQADINGINDFTATTDNGALYNYGKLLMKLFLGQIMHCIYSNITMDGT
jgi:hypothetical protein